MIWSTLAGMWCRYAPQPRKKGTSPATAEGRHPGGDAMLQRGRPLDQPRVDVLEARLFIDGDEVLDSGIPVGGIGRRPEAAGDEHIVQRLAQLREIAVAAHLAGEAA